MIPAPEWTPTNAEYHATVGRWSSSRLATFRRSPWEAYCRYVNGTMPHGQPSVAMLLGSAVSQTITDPPAIGEHVYVAAAGSRNTKAFREADEAYSASRVVLTEPEFAAVQGMLASLDTLQTSHAKAARALLLDLPGHSEYGHRWEEQVELTPTHQTPGGVFTVPCMLKTDRLIVLNGRPTIVELKTARDPSPFGFQRACYNLGYKHQAAFYRRGVADRLGCAEAEIAVYYVVVGNAWPHEVVVYPAADRYLAVGAEQVRRDLARLAACLAAGDERVWRQPYELAETLTPVDLMPWEVREGRQHQEDDDEDNDNEGGGQSGW